MEQEIPFGNTILKENTSQNINSVYFLDEIVQAIQKLDIKSLYYLLNPNQTYQGFERDIFLENLKQAIYYLEAGIDNHIEIVEGSCGGNCLNGNIGKGYLFIGDTTRNFINLMFIIENNRIINIKECTLFKSNRPNLELNRQFYIDKSRGRLLDVLQFI